LAATHRWASAIASEVWAEDDGIVRKIATRHKQRARFQQQCSMIQCSLPQPKCSRCGCGDVKPPVYFFAPKACAFLQNAPYFDTKISSFFTNFATPILCFHRLTGFVRKKTIFFS
jgi:hypothetical protein